MIKNLQLLIFSKTPYYNSDGFCRFLSYFTKISTSSSDTLFKRLLPTGDPKISIVPILDQWVQEGRPIDETDLKFTVNLLRKYKRHGHALELADWINDKKLSNQSPGDVAVRLDLICKVHGLQAAEHYFSNVSDTIKTLKVYGSLLNCYANSKSMEKAEAIMQKIRELGYSSRLCYDVMLNLYSKLREREKLEKLAQEMEAKGISFVKFTFCVFLNVYAADSDIAAMEKLLLKMENDHLVSVDWHVYAIAAKGYLRAGLEEKTVEMLKKTEEVIRGKQRGLAYEMLITMYATLGNDTEVNRIWHVYKKKGHSSNMGYFHIITSLIRLNDIDGAAKILEDWESQNKYYDWRIPNTLINAYTKVDLMPKAEALVNRAIECGKRVPRSTSDLLATGYYKTNQMEKAVDMMERAIFYSRDTSWKLNHVTLEACLKYLQNKGDAEKEELIKLLRKRGIFSKRLASFTLHSGSSEGYVSDGSERNNQNLDEELDWIHSEDVNNN